MTIHELHTPYYYNGIQIQKKVLRSLVWNIRPRQEHR